jgi:hypothetical protein
MRLQVKGHTYEIFDVVEGTSAGSQVRAIYEYHLFYAKDTNSKLYWIKYVLPASDRENMTYEEVLTFAIYNKHSEMNELIGRHYENFIYFFSMNRYHSLKTKLRKYLIQQVLGEE